MMIKLAWKNLKYKYLSSLLCWIALSVSIGMISLLIILKYNFEKRYTRNIEGIDMVIGAKGSPLQLILSAVYHIDAPTGNISLEEAEKWYSHPHVEKYIPLAYGDSYKGISIVGSSDELLNHYNATLENGKHFHNNFEVVIGASVHEKLKLETENKFFSTHGADVNGEQHTHQPYTVTGVLKKTGTVLDNLIITSVRSVWDIHDHEHHHDHDETNEHDHHHEYEKQLTAVLLKFKNPMGLVQLPRIINEQTSMMAAVPAIEVNRLFSLFGAGADILQKMAMGVMLLAAMIVFVTLYNSLNDRKYELALMRTLGISRFKILLSVMTESIILSMTGLITGLLLSRCILYFLTGVAEDVYHLEWHNLWQLTTGEYGLMLTALLLGIFTALIPALKVWTINISKTLADG